MDATAEVEEWLGSGGEPDDELETLRRLYEQGTLHPGNCSDDTTAADPN